ncbi:MAG: hypothetical protein OHK0015_29650 [Chloroflexi bacterium OHK40]|jgi:ribosomal protein S27E
MSVSENHVMRIVGTHSSGAEEWHCPACGRRLLLFSRPALRRSVLEPGDMLAIHSGGSGAPSASGATHLDSPASADDELSPELLRPWLKALQALEDEGFGKH